MPEYMVAIYIIAAYLAGLPFAAFAANMMLDHESEERYMAIAWPILVLFAALILPVWGLFAIGDWLASDFRKWREVSLMSKANKHV